MCLNKSIAGLISLTLITVLSGCSDQQSEKDMIAEAQFCLDKSTAATANSCLGKIQGLTTPQSYALRCAAGFIAEGITSPENLSSAMSAISNGAGATSLLSVISFDSQTTANQVFDNCNKSQQNGFALMGAMAKSATVLSAAASNLGSCSTSCSAQQISDTITAITDGLAGNGTMTPAEAEQNIVNIVTAISTVYDTTCSTTASVNSDICGQINSAATQAGVPDISNMTSQEQIELGKKLLAEWQSQ